MQQIKVNKIVVEAFCESISRCSFASSYFALLKKRFFSKHKTQKTLKT